METQLLILLSCQAFSNQLVLSGVTKWNKIKIYTLKGIWKVAKKLWYGKCFQCDLHITHTHKEIFLKKNQILKLKKIIWKKKNGFKTIWQTKLLILLQYIYFINNTIVSTNASVSTH